ncbi:MAG: glycosyltransferase [Rhodospirillaceae bacterium]|nr:glycosyltransferase [Rhodospirillaceae bacterium]|tara:strand:+ start:21558 stop:22433 length:876 start_codon:yes stop_codon:yes gene_type:complete
MSSSEKAPLSVLIPTKNEERNLEECMASVSWADEIVVYDSHSTDDTIAIAEKAGATIVKRVFDTFAVHKNWALDNIDFRNKWILLLDADERVTDLLAEEIKNVIKSEEGSVGYHIARKTVFCGSWMRHSGVYPDYNLRLIQKGRGRYEDRIVHEHMIVDGGAGYLKDHLLHDDDKGIERFFDRHNHYTSLEAVEILRERKKAGGEKLGGNFFERGPQRRRALKNFAQRYLPFRPMFLFIYMYVLKLGFLDGRMGLRYCLLKMFFEYQIVLKVKEMRDPESPLYQKHKDLLE